MSRKADSNQQDLFINDTRSYRYLMILNPGFHITEKVNFFRQKLNSINPVYGEETRSKPHLTLCYFDSSYACDQLIVERMQQAVAGVRSFELTVKGVDYWPPGTFYIKVDNPVAVVDIVNKIKDALPGVKVSLNPHITIVRKLKRQDYVQLDEQDFDFQITSPCYSVTILRQLLGNHIQPFELVQKIDLVKP